MRRLRLFTLARGTASLPTTTLLVHLSITLSSALDTRPPGGLKAQHLKPAAPSRDEEGWPARRSAPAVCVLVSVFGCREGCVGMELCSAPAVCVLVSMLGCWEGCVGMELCDFGLSEDLHSLDQPGTPQAGASTDPLGAVVLPHAQLLLWVYRWIYEGISSACSSPVMGARIGACCGLAILASRKPRLSMSGEGVPCSMCGWASRCR